MSYVFYHRDRYTTKVRSRLTVSLSSARRMPHTVPLQEKSSTSFHTSCHAVCSNEGLIKMLWVQAQKRKSRGVQVVLVDELLVHLACTPQASI